VSYKGVKKEWKPVHEQILCFASGVGKTTTHRPMENSSSLLKLPLAVIILNGWKMKRRTIF
jgi:hypothetical protein